MTLELIRCNKLGFYRINQQNYKRLQNQIYLKELSFLKNFRNTFVSCLHCDYKMIFSYEFILFDPTGLQIFITVYLFLDLCIQRTRKENTFITSIKNIRLRDWLTGNTIIPLLWLFNTIFNIF